jgi:hypothetical protein
MRTRGLLNVLQLVFGLTYTNLSVYLRFGLRLFVETFRDDLLARVSIPSAEEIKLLKEASAVQHPLLTDCWATMVASSSFCNNRRMQTSKNVTTMAGRTTTTSRSYFFYPDGTIPIAFFNVPGLVHNSQVAEHGNIYGKLEDVFWLTGAKCSINLAFGQVNREYLYKLSQDLFGSSAPTRHARKLELQKKAGNIVVTDI